jgi:hypothetical protein
MQRLPESKYVTIAIANRKFLHLVCSLNKRTVYYVGAILLEFNVQSLRVAHPEKGIPRSSLLFSWYDKVMCRDSTQHDRETIATTDGKLERRARRVLTTKS